MSDKITDNQKQLLVKLGYDAPKPVESLTKQEAAVCINARLAAARANSPNRNHRRGAALLRSGRD